MTSASIARGMEPSWLPILRCPATGQPLELDGERLSTPGGERSYPIVDGVPILIADELSLFAQAEYLPGGGRHERHEGGLGEASTEVDARAAIRSPLGRLRAAVTGRLPSLSRNVTTRENLAELVALLRERAAEGRRPRVLVVAGQIAGKGFEPLLEATDIELVETDVGIGPRTRIVCDAMRLPFADGAFDAVSLQAVLDIVPEPDQAVAEAHRVLAPGGLVYSEIAFMQQYHEGDYDYFRYTLLGHRRLFRAFDVTSMGVQCGPGMSLAWTIRAYMLAWARSSVARDALSVAARVLLWWLPYTDDVLARRPRAVEAASGTFVLGRRRAEALDDRQVLAEYTAWRRSL